jgi:hypothetical protein
MIYFTGDYNKILRRLEGAVRPGAAPGLSGGAGKPVPRRLAMVCLPRRPPTPPSAKMASPFRSLHG